MELKLGLLPRYQKALLRLFYPSLCALCTLLLELEEEGLCRNCFESLRRFRLLPSEERIRIPLTHAKEAWTLFRYEEGIKEILHKIKFGKRRDLLHLFTEEIRLFCERRRHLAEYDSLAVIPLDPWRRIEREFNPSGLLAEKVQEILNLPLEKKALVKRRSTFSQTKLGREARKLNLEGVFRAPDPWRIRGKSMLVVDDIFTTGATLEEAGKTLRAAGASRVGFLTLARTFPS